MFSAGSIHVGLLCGLLGAVTPARSDKDDAAAAILSRVERPEHILRGRDELVALGPALLPSLFGWLVTGAVSTPGAQPFELDSCRSATVRCALGALPHPGLVDFLTTVARRSDEEAQRVTGLDVLAQLGVKGDLKLALELGFPGDASTPPSTVLQEALESSLLAILSREPGAARTLAGFFPRTQPFAQASIAAVISRSGVEETLDVLASLLASATTEADALLLLEIGRVAAEGQATRDPAALERVRGYLGHPDHRLGVLACVAVERLHDHEAVPDLIALLGESDANVRTRAYAALTSLTGVSLPCEPEPWMTWLDTALTWWDERADACRVALVSGTPAEAVAAIREVAKQRLFQQRTTQVLELALQRPETEVAQEALRALGTIHDPAAQDALEKHRAYSEPPTVPRAHKSPERTRRIPRWIRPTKE